MPDQFKAALMICGFFLASVAWYGLANILVYLLSTLLIPVVEEVVKVNAFRTVRFRKAAGLKIVGLFVVFESIFKLAFAPSFAIPGISTPLVYFIVLSPAAFHFFNFAVALTLARRGMRVALVVVACAILHYAFNVYRAYVPMSLYVLYLTDPFLLSAAGFAMIRAQRIQRRQSASEEPQLSHVRPHI